ncbi:hypothetical protein BT93_H1054 [Corymbia citriodora subsp. variegata]|nr:hypothetical protein BT93_H1054 [Corymbia citriodora subsp. variegata]
MSNERQCVVEQKTKDGKGGGKRVGLKWRREFSLEFHIDKAKQHRNNAGENGMKGIEGRRASDVSVGMMADRRCENSPKQFHKLYIQ